MNTLAVDIGGTKFSLALFEGEKMVRRESRATDRDGGPEWMLLQIEAIASNWEFGGVDYDHEEGDGDGFAGRGFGGGVAPLPAGADRQENAG